MKILLRSIYFFIILNIIIIKCIIPSTAQNEVFEYYYIPEANESTTVEPSVEFDRFIKSLPEDVKDNLPDEIIKGNTDDFTDSVSKLADFSSLWKKICSIFSDNAFSVLKITFEVAGIVLLSSLFHNFKRNMSDSLTGSTVDSVINVGLALTIINSGLVSFIMLEDFTKLLTQIMNGMIPFLAAVYSISGNVGTSAVQTGGVMMLVALCNNLYTYILMPAIRVCLILSVVQAVFSELRLKPIIISFRNITTGIIFVSVTLFSFVLGLQNSIVQSADNFGAKSIKFMLGNLIPIIGGAVSDSLNTIGGSLAMLKTAGGTAAIIIIILLIAPPLISLLLHRFSVYLCKLFSEITGCDGEASLLGDIGSVLSIMIAFVVSISIAFIYSLTLFTSSVLAVSS